MCRKHSYKLTELVVGERSERGTLGSVTFLTSRGLITNCIGLSLDFRLITKRISMYFIASFYCATWNLTMRPKRTFLSLVLVTVLATIARAFDEPKEKVP